MVFRRMQHQIQLALKLVAHLIENAINVVVLRHVAFCDQRVVAKGLRQLTDVILQSFALVCERQVRARLFPRLRDGPRDRSLVCHAKDDACFAR